MLVLAAAMMGIVLVGIDVSVINVAVETIQTSFGVSLGGLQWVLNIYTLAYATLLLNAGAISDRYGPRATFASGFLLFTLASAACGLAPTFAVLLAARLAQGTGAALLVPASLTLLRIAFPDPQRRSWAIGLWAGAGSVALAGGPVLGGSLVELFGWRSIFLINIPIGVVGLWLTFRHAPDLTRSGRQRLDLPGLVIGALALVALTGAITQASAFGWSNGWVLGGMSGGGMGIVALLLVETRSAHPMMPLSIFKNRRFSVPVAIGFLVNFAFYGLIFVLSLFFQFVQKRSALETGLAFVPMTAVIIVVNLAAGRLNERWGLRSTLVVGLLASGLGYLLLLGTDAGSLYVMMVPGFVLAGTGIAMVVPALMAAALSSVESERAGVASGILNAVRQVGGAIGVALFGSLIGTIDPDRFTNTLHVILSLAAVPLIGGAMVAILLMPSREAET